MSSNVRELGSRTGPWSLATADLSGVSPRVLDDGEWIASELERVLSVCLGAVEWRTHRFAPRGLSLVGTALRGRVIVHTWPERGALTIDLYGELDEIGPALDAGVTSVLRGMREAV